MKKRKTINVVTLGCAKNLVDSEHIMAQLEVGGYDIINDSNDTQEAKIVVINTCGFINDAKEESIECILQFAQAKQEGEIERLFVIGCLSERYADELRDEIPEVDDYFGVKDLSGVIKALGVEYDEKRATERYTTTPQHYAYLKIGEGCNWHCAYCAIPIIRGNHVSVPMEQVLEEAEKLAADGVKELIVVAQDTTYYGLDLYGERKLAELLRRLCRVEGIEWVRLHYTYPADFPQEVIEVMRDEEKICNYIDIPLQHISDNQLKSMRRRITKQQTVELMERLRREIPDIAIRTTLLTGFPGETEQDFEELVEFVKEQRFDRLGVFAYSEEEGTPSAKMEDDVPQEEKERRVEQIMMLQSVIAEQKNEERVGKTTKVIIDSREGDFWVGRTQYDSPEVDQEVLIEATEELEDVLEEGSFHIVEIIGVEGYDLYGKVVNGPVSE
ncbi:MAG: 30S ribosomal protein S12 methylthiotransferase RimO [Tidjanibacter sp.]|nr:30S ribosomal protein S12 methylthiotransferase RimO [Tidjanibacter sp.]